MVEDLTNQERQRDIFNQILRHTTQDTKAIGALLLADIMPEYRVGFLKLATSMDETLRTVNSMLDNSKAEKTEN